MSRLSSMVERPFTKTLQWKNEKYDKKLKKVVTEKGWYFYQKSTVEGEKGVNVAMEEPLKGLWLLSATSFTGYNESEKKSVYSNEVLSEYDLKEIFPKNAGENVVDYGNRLKSYMVLTAKLGKDTIAEGFYKDIKDTVTSKSMGGKYCQPNYFLLLNKDGSTEIVRFLFSGGSIETWIPFAGNKGGLKRMATVFTGSDERSKGGVDYEVPLFEFEEVDEKYSKLADEAAQRVTDYFKFLLTNEATEELVTEETAVVEDSMPWDKK